MVDLTKDADQKHRAWWKIKNKRFFVSIPTYLIPHREEEAKLHGAFSTGSRYTDQQLVRAREQIWLPLIDLINIYFENGDFTFLKPNKDIPIIHGILQDHINDFLEAEKIYATGLYYEDPDVLNERRRDMLQLDEFAREIYKRAFKKSIPTTERFTGYEVMESPFGVRQDNRRDKTTVPPYRSITQRLDYPTLTTRRRRK